MLQTTWLLAYKHIGDLRDPAAFADWLATTATREALRLVHRRVREVVSDEPCAVDVAEAAHPADLVLPRTRRLR